MSVLHFLLELEASGINIELVDENLKIKAPEGVLKPNLISELKSKKGEILEFLKNRQKQNKYASIEPLEEQEHYEVSPAQRRMWVLCQIEESSVAYNMPAAYILNGSMNPEDFGKAFRMLVQRHESLRTVFITADGEPRQKILAKEEIDFTLEEMDLRKEDNANREKRARILADKEGTRVFNLVTGPLLSARLLRLQDEKYLLLLNMNHIISDGWSMGVLINQLGMLYNAVLHGGESGLLPLKIQYKDFSAWQNNFLKSEDLLKQEAYWVEKYSDEIPVLAMPGDYTRPLRQSFAGDTTTFEIDEELTRRLHILANHSGCTLYMVLLSVYNVLLSKYSGQYDIIVGSPSAGRSRPDLENIIGMFVNTLAMRNYPEPGKRFEDFLQEVKENTLEVFENQDYQFEHLVEHLDLRRDTGRNPLFDTMFVMQNLEHAGILVKELAFKPYELENKISKFDLGFQCRELDDKLAAVIEYCAKLFKKETILGLAGHFVTILEEVVRNPGIRLADIKMLSAEEEKQVLYEFNAARADYPKDKSLAQLFAEQAARTPDGTAVIGLVPGAAGGSTRALTYRELNERCRCLAWKLVEKGVTCDTIVGLMLERSVEMIIGILGILKAGGAYLPIEPDYPPERTKYILKDSNVKVLVTTSSLAKEDRKNLEIIVFNSSSLSRFPVSSLPPFPASHPYNMAYVIYTSGSTGKPKGVMVEYGSLINMLFTLFERYPFSKGDTYLLKTAYTFDVSVSELFGWFLGGGRLAILESGGEKDPQKILDWVEQVNITHINFVPSMFGVFLDVLGPENIDKLSRLKYIFLAGEALLPHLIMKFKKLNTGIVLENIYGPTESTIYASQYSLSQWKGEGVGNIPIGKPLQNLRLYILNPYNQIQPIGVPGELCISGEGLARGYLNRPELTNEKFIANTLVEKQRFYRSGDLARWLPDGNVEFLGRMDHQVKIRGFRIELGEIEHQLLTHGKIKEAIVLAREDNNDKYLCAYMVAKPGETNPIDHPGIREYLSNHLPDYMIPSYFVQLDNIPLTPNGKIDQKVLPAPVLEAGKHYEAPRDDIEKKLVNLWSDILNVEKERIGIDANFFHLGGHSLKATVLASRIHKELNINVPLTGIFKTPYIRGLAVYIKETARSKHKAIEPVEKKEYYALSSAQRRLYILRQMEAEQGTAYNIPSVWQLEGEFDKGKTERIFHQLIRRHEGLRTSFMFVNDEPVQKIHEEVAFAIDDYETDEIGADHLIKTFTRPFDLSRAPLLRVGLIKTESSRSRYLLLLDMHHIITDGISQPLLRNEFKWLCAGEGEGEELPPLRLQYKDYSQWQNSERQQALIKDQEAYWLKEFSDELPVLNLPTDYPRPLMQSFAGSTVEFVLTRQETQTLKGMAKEANATLYMAALSVFNILLSKLSGQEDIIVGTPILGRRHTDLEPIIGMFVNTLAMRNRPCNEKTFKEFLIEVKERTLETYENQEYQFEDLVDKISVHRDTSRNPVFDVMFNLMNQEDYTGDIPGIDERSLPGPEPGHEYKHRPGTSKFDLTLAAIEAGERLFFVVEYCTKLFAPGTIERIISYSKQLLFLLWGNRDQKISELEIITEPEKQRILYKFNDTRAGYPVDIVDMTLHKLFERQVEKGPDNRALVYKDNQLTYRELYEKTDRLAGVLRSKGEEAGSIVGIIVERSIEMILGILGILKVGGAYLPIDPETPGERIRYILEDSHSKLLLGERVLTEGLRDGDRYGYGYEVINLEDTELYKGGSKESGKVESEGMAKDLAYVIYTSGSTGKPKGVLVEQRSVINILSALDEAYPVEEADVYLLKTSYTFDVSVTELFGWFFGDGGGGGVLAILEKHGEKDPREILETIERYCIGHINFVPSMFNVFVDTLNQGNRGKLSSLKYIFLAGEALLPDAVNKFRALNSRVVLENLYGPTEATIYASKYSLREWSGNRNTPIPIGRPLPNMKLYIVDRNNNLQAIGIGGELCIGGVGLGRGYLNRVELTVEKFGRAVVSHLSLVISSSETLSKVPKDLCPMPNDRLYRSGDLARWQADGNIEFLGRLDNQVKIRGFRIELGEIENELLNHDHIKEAAVAAKKDQNGENYLCAYIISEVEIPGPELRSLLLRHLPGHMIPLYFVRLDKLPLTTSGKVNRKVLPEPEQGNAGRYAAPRNEVEKKLAHIWSEILGIEKNVIGIDTNFFELGGHSLKATLLTAKIHKTLDVKVPLAKIFKISTIRGLSGYITAAAKERYASPGAAEEKEYYPLSSAQRSLYLQQQLQLKSSAYNIPSIVQLEGEIDENRLEEAFRKLIKRHESLRTSFEMRGDQPVQKIHKYNDPEFKIEYYETTDIHHSFFRPFDLSHAPLLRVRLVELEEKKHLLMVDMHHIITDGVSQGLLIRDFTALYSGKELPGLKFQYRDFSVWQNSEKERLKKQEEYWLRQFEGEIPVLKLPTDYARPRVQSFDGNSTRFQIGKEETNGLNLLARNEDATLYMVLLTIYMIMLSKISRQQDIIVGTPAANRQHADTDQIIGMFVNTLAMRNSPRGEITYREFLKEVKTNTLAAFENQEYYIEDLVNKVVKTVDTSRNKLFSVMFALQNTDIIPTVEIATAGEEPGLKAKPYDYKSRTAKFDLNFLAAEQQDQLLITVEYSTKLFKEKTVQRFTEYFKEIVSVVLENNEIKLEDIDISCDLREVAANLPETGFVF